MTWVLILVIFPTGWAYGTEQHVNYETETQCRAALGDFQPQRDHFKLCVPKSEEFWHYPKQAPGAKEKP